MSCDPDPAAIDGGAHRKGATAAPARDFWLTRLTSPRSMRPSETGSMKFLPIVLAAFAMQFLTACWQISVTVYLKPDGSGLVDETISMSDQMIHETGGPEKFWEQFNETNSQARAKAMGEGVAFISTTPVKAEGRQTAVRMFSFTDVSRLAVFADPWGMNGDKPPDKKKDAPPVVVRFKKDAVPELTISNLFTPGPDPVKGDPKDDITRIILGELRLSFSVEVQGTIEGTNATHRDGDSVILQDFNGEKILADWANFEAMSKFRDWNSAEAKALLRRVKGVKIEMENPLRIRFR
jgi:hypothetical protein